MSISVVLSSAATWHQLERISSPSASSGHGKISELPTVQPHGMAWSVFTRNKGLHGAYVSELTNSITSIQNFIKQNAAKGADKTAAISALNDYLQTRVNCKPERLSHLTVNENRRNLHLFAQQLSNPEITPEQKISAALTLGQGMDVCTEGVSLHIQTATRQMLNSQKGFVGMLVNTKDLLIEQHLQALVEREDGKFLSASHAKEMQIHHVQALKNHVANDWGLPVSEDRYAKADYQEQVGRMAQTLLAETITPAVLANTIAENLTQSFVNHTQAELRTGMPSENLKTEPLRQAIQAEFGDNIELDQCLEFNDDYTQVQLKPQSELALMVMESLQEVGLVPKHANASQLLAQKTKTLQHALQDVTSLRGAIAKNPESSGLIQAFWFGAVQSPATQTDKDDKNHRRHHSLGHNLQRL